MRLVGLCESDVVKFCIQICVKCASAMTRGRSQSSEKLAPKKGLLASLANLAKCGIVDGPSRPDDPLWRDRKIATGEKLLGLVSHAILWKMLMLSEMRYHKGRCTTLNTALASISSPNLMNAYTVRLALAGPGGMQLRFMTPSSYRCITKVCLTTWTSSIAYALESLVRAFCVTSTVHKVATSQPSHERQMRTRSSG